MTAEKALKIDPSAPEERAGHSEARGDDRGATLKKGAIVVALTAFAGIAFFAVGSGKKAVSEKPDQVTIAKSAVFEPAVAPVASAPAMMPKPSPIPAALVAEPATAPKGPDMLEAARRAPVVAFQKSAANISGGGRVLGYQQSDDEKGVDGGTFERLMKPTKLDGARAGYLGNRDFIIAMGTSIPCVLETALQSDQPGFTTCVINRDVLSDNGRVVLMAKGTQVVGEYRGGLKNGQSRLFVLWNRAKTPEGVIVTLGSPATDGLGRAGFDGQVDNHWFERFGSALLLSIVTDASTYAVQKVGQNSQVQLNSTGQSGKQAAAIAVEQSAAIAPTLSKHQGELVNIMVGRDLDFSQVYRLRVLPPGQRSTAWEAAVVPAGPQPDVEIDVRFGGLKD